MGAFQLVDEKIKRIEEPVGPVGPQVSREDQERYIECYNEYQRKLDKCRLGPLTSKRFKKLVDGDGLEIPTITLEEIKDRSKGDGLLKLIAVLQTLWFITQCIARGVQGLPLTQLELVTLAIVVLNVAASAFWWRKPLGVEEPMNTFVQAKLEEDTREDEGQDPVEGDKPDVTARQIINGTASKAKLAIKFIFDPLRYYREKDLSLASSLGLYAVRLPYRLMFVLTYPILLAFPFATLFLLWAMKTKPQTTQDRNTVFIRLLLALRIFPYKLTHSIRKYFGNDDGPLGKISIPEYYRSYQHPSFVLNWFFVVPASFLLLVFLLTILSPLFAISFIASFVLTVNFEINPPNITWHRATHVPTFYAPHIERHRYSRVIVFASCCAVFGGTQCLAWNSSFPTYPERLIWRLAAVWFCFPVPVINAGLMDRASPDPGQHRRLRDAVKDVNDILGLSFYAFTRFSFVVLALASLRRQPAAAFDTIDWTRYIPHLSYR